MEDYRVYRFCRKELVWNMAMYLVLDGIISHLFFRSWLAFLLFFPGAALFLREQKKLLLKKRKIRMQSQFLTGMQLVCTSLQAGYAVENAFREALQELGKIYDEDAFIIREFRFLVKQIGLNRTVEALLMDLGNRSGVEDIRNFAEVFSTAKRTGGDLIAITRNTVSSIQQKQETMQEIETSLSGKVMERNMMSAIPLFMIGYVEMTSPGFLDVMYHNTAGLAVMSACLLVYGIAFLWGRKVTEIQI
ncbi:MAG: type II secretion system F family protein [Lachnospiraceae bacterium]|nr:type II secretion system F family protein [Lachnospiraceae bacterium]